MAKYKYKRVMVWWVDTAHYRGWQLDGHDDLRPAEVRTVGWLIEKTDETLTIAQSITSDLTADVLVIPAQCVREITTLEKRKR